MTNVYPTRTKILLLIVTVVFSTIVTIEPASAYAGMGAMIPAIGNGMMLMFIMGMTFVGLLIQPCKMMIQSLKKKNNKS